MKMVFNEPKKKRITYDGMINELGQVIHGGVEKNEISSVQDEQGTATDNDGSE